MIPHMSSINLKSMMLIMKKMIWIEYLNNFAKRNIHNLVVISFNGVLKMLIGNTENKDIHHYIIDKLESINLTFWWVSKNLDKSGCRNMIINGKIKSKIYLKV